MIDLGKVRNYYIACGYTDLRYDIDGLAAVLNQQFGGHLDEEGLFLCCGRRTNHIKALYWSGDGPAVQTAVQRTILMAPVKSGAVASGSPELPPEKLE